MAEPAESGYDLRINLRDDDRRPTGMGVLVYCSVDQVREGDLVETQAGWATSDTPILYIARGEDQHLLYMEVGQALRTQEPEGDRRRPSFLFSGRRLDDYEIRQMRATASTQPIPERISSPAKPLVSEPKAKQGGKDSGSLFSSRLVQGLAIAAGIVTLIGFGIVLAQLATEDDSPSPDPARPSTMQVSE